MTPLARLSFWIPPDKTETFGRTYTTLALPLLRVRGWQEAGIPQRPAPPGVFSRLFGVARPEQIPLMEGQLRRDPRWRELEAGLRRTLDQDELRWCFRVYTARVGAGRIAEAGGGQRQGLWYTLGVQDRLPSAMATYLLQDRRGRLWGGTYGKGTWCYDGAYIRSFGMAEGLAGDTIWTIFEDRQGDIWFGTDQGGISRYDGESIETYAEADGLGDATVQSIREDHRGRLWI